LVKDADVLIEDTYPGQDAELGLDYQTLSKVNPNLVVTSITPFGKTGIYKNYKAYPLNLAHSSGAAYVLPCGDTYLAYPDREPIKTGGYLYEYNAADDAVLATLAALFWRGAGGSGQHVDISRREAIASLSRYEFARFNQGFIENRNSRSFPVGGLMVCKDGYVEVMLMEKKNWEGLIKLIGNPEWASREEYQFEKVVKGFGKQEDLNPRIKQEVNDYITCWMLEHTKEEIFHQGQALGACITMVATTRDVSESKQLAARNYFVEVDHPSMGKYKFPTWPYKFSAVNMTIDRPAPLLGQHNEEILTKLGYSKEEMVQLKAAGVI
jgi:CoA:oxalate CoA-transferase